MRALILLALSPFAMLAMDATNVGSGRITNEEMDKLVKEYVKLGLPMPTPLAPLVRYHYGSSWSQGEDEKQNYVLGFLLSKDEKTRKAEVLIGNYLDTIDYVRDPIEVVYVMKSDPDKDGIECSRDTPFDMNTGLATAIQCHSRGYTSLAEYIVRRSLSGRNMYRGGGDFVSSGGTWKAPRSKVSQAEPGPHTPHLEVLAALAWNHWKYEISPPCHWHGQLMLMKNRRKRGLRPVGQITEPQS